MVIKTSCSDCNCGLDHADQVACGYGRSKGFIKSPEGSFHL